jgi:hypothetical protein
MVNLLAIGGVPASGKTTLMFEIISFADDWEIVKPKKLLDAMYSKKLDLYVLGKYEKDGSVFQGTDRLSMAVQPDAESFISEIQSGNVVFEGDRLFNQKFLEKCIDKTNAKIIVLLVKQNVLDQRHIDRKDSQDEKFLTSRNTKISNICGSLSLFDYIHLMRNETPGERQLVLAEIATHLNLR